MTHDPEQGCGLMLIAAGIIALVIVLTIAYGLFR